MKSGRFSDAQLWFIISSLQLILKNNFFMFEDKYYLQIHGTAVGYYASLYVIAFMVWVENTLFMEMICIKYITWNVFDTLMMFSQLV